MRANRRDANHKDIVVHARSLGFFVWDVADLKNCCDMVLVRNGHVFFCEIKDGQKCASQKRMTPGEITFKAEIEKQGAIHLVIENEKQINELFRKTL